MSSPPSKANRRHEESYLPSAKASHAPVSSEVELLFMGSAWPQLGHLPDPAKPNEAWRGPEIASAFQSA